MLQSAFRMLWAVYALLLAIASLQPARPSGLHASALHPLLHLASFAVLYLLSRSAFPAWLWQTFAGSILFGLTLELAQSALYHFSAEWPDVVTDALGVFIGSAVWALYAMHKKRVRS
jgi:glycopeptide antibiotics resistance protein